jgi:hypothetical protein
MVGNTLLTHTKRAMPSSASEMKRFIKGDGNTEMVGLPCRDETAINDPWSRVPGLAA